MTLRFLTNAQLFCFLKLTTTSVPGSKKSRLIDIIESRPSGFKRKCQLIKLIFCFKNNFSRSTKFSFHMFSKWLNLELINRDASFCYKKLVLKFS